MNMPTIRQRSLRMTLIATVFAIGLPLGACPASASDTPSTLPQLTQLYELSTPVGGYFYTASAAERDSAIRDHGFGPAGSSAARFISRTVFPGSVALHRLRAADRSVYRLARPDEAAVLRDSGDWVDEGVLGHADADGQFDPSRLPTGERLAAVYQISYAGIWRAANARVMGQYCYQMDPPWHLDGKLPSLWALEAA
ncbi:hypothetical protein [Nonomuraea angiospora]|uniref:hypothetical protein n=1 Tax=Nonomuraea angiospora TaxID=46172 RepID=UPI0029A1917C|nr:hypothetical protein [Nonomuraea angiospora]MDX3104495.1 hypothetical protein [Nonomuraea angiospora]